MYPSIKLPPLPNVEGPQKTRYLKFDRILADVPCSGDGTARKNYNVWKDWNPSNALGLHLTQARILVRALQMLKVGGRVVYSTCSMNPVENESVIASAIQRCGGAQNVKIVDCSQELPGLKRAAGLKTWKVMDREGRIWSSWKEVEEHKESQGIEGLFRLSEGMFPPLGEGADLPLERCMRIYPHQQDTGGFFITVLEKTSEIRAKPEDNSSVIPRAPVTPVANLTAELDARKNSNDDPQAKLSSLDNVVVPDPEVQAELAKNQSVAEATNQPPYSATLGASDATANAKRDNQDFEEEVPAKRVKLDSGIEALVGDRPVHDPVPAGQVENVAAPTKPTSGPGYPGKKKGSHQEDPYKYLDPNHEELAPIFDFYQLSERFPRDRFMVRNADGAPHKTIYYTSALARDILTQNEGSGMKFVHCGVKMFVKQDAQRENVCRWRIQTDGLKITEPWVGEARSVTLTARETLRKLLIEMFPKVNDDGWKNLGEIGARVKDIPMGCSILRVEPNGKEDGLNERMVLPLWRSLHSLNLMLPKEERRAMLLRIFNDDTPLVNATLKNQNKPDASGTSGTDTPMQETPAISTAGADNAALKNEDTQLAEDEQAFVESRESFVKIGDEEDTFNTTV
ncbi:hypothetical protein N7470_009500 [Penicillium chermesinum]|nr:hypothetical protein N7470_009500 [Penicillium chermesinum]